MMTFKVSPVRLRRKSALVMLFVHAPERPSWTQCPEWSFSFPVIIMKGRCYVKTNS